MASRSHTTFAKRQKELARVQKQRDKIAKRVQRKAEKRANPDVNQDQDLEVLTAPAPPPDDLA